MEFCDPIICVDDNSDDCQGLGLNLGCGLVIDDEGRLDIIRPFSKIVGSAAELGGPCPIVGDDTEACIPRVEACFTNTSACPVVVVPQVRSGIEVTDKPHVPATNPRLDVDFSINGAPFTLLANAPLLTEHSRVDASNAGVDTTSLEFSTEVAPGGRFCFALRSRVINADGGTLNVYAVSVRLQALGGADFA